MNDKSFMSMLKVEPSTLTYKTIRIKLWMNNRKTRLVLYMSSVVDLVKERFGELTEIQKLAIPKILAGENVLILAPTGSGKTESALLPILEQIHEKKDGIRVLYITPLRALNRDLLKRFNWWCERLEVSHAVRSGDTTQSERDTMRKKPPQILLTTIESLQALLMGPVMRRHLAKIEFVIVDEIHDVLDNKRGAQLSMGLERLAEIAKFNRVGISATVANEEQAARLIFGEKPYSVAEVPGGRKMEINVELIPDQKEKVKEISKIAEKERTLIFSNTRSLAEELGASLKALNAPVEVHHGSLSKEVRIAAEDKFKSGEIKSLLATSSLELGIDIGDVNYVIQYSSPHQSFRLIQRIGRSGHALDRTPKGTIFANDIDDKLEAEAILLRATNRWIEDKRVEQGALDVIAHQLVGLCMDFGQMSLRDAHKILSRSYAYGISLLKLKKVALQLFSEGILIYDEQGSGDVETTEITIRGTSKARIYYYSNLSTIAKEKRYLMREVSANRILASLDEAFVMNLDFGASFLAKGQAWRVIDITEKEVLVEPSSASEVAIPDWTGEDIPVDFEIAQDVGKLRKAMRKVEPLPDDKTVVMEIVEDIIVIHACFGTKVNEAISRIFSKRISEHIGESVRAVADPYRIIIKLPYPLDEKYLSKSLNGIGNVRNELEQSLANSFMLKFRFTHVGRLFGLLAEDATVTHRFIDYMRNSVVYEEAMRSIFFRYFDIEKTEKVLELLGNGKIKLVIDKRKELSYFGKLGVQRLSSREAIGGFEPRAEMIKTFKARMLEKTVQLKCVGCGSIRFLHLAGASEKIKCAKCGSESLFIFRENIKKSKADEEYESGLVRNFGKWAVYALASYGVGARTADRVLANLRRSEDDFWWDLIEAQKNFIKNKKYWKI